MEIHQFRSAVARLSVVWQDRARIAWLPWPIGALALFGIAKAGFDLLAGSA